MVFLVHHQPCPSRREGCRGTEGITSAISGSVTFLLVAAIPPCLLSWCYCSHVRVCASKVQTGLRWQNEGELKHVQMSCWSAHHSKLSSACSLSVNHFILFFFSFFSSVFESFPPLMLSTGWVLQSGIQHLWVLLILPHVTQVSSSLLLGFVWTQVKR